MKLTKLATFLMLNIFSLSASSIAHSADIRVNIEDPGAAPAENPEWLAEDQTSESDADIKFMSAMLEKAQLGGVLSPAEISAVNAKKHILFKYMWEQEQLDSLRTYLRDIETDKAKREALDSQFPYTPEEVFRIRKLEKEIEEATNSPIDSVEFNVKTVELDPSARNLIEVHISKGYSSSITFFDEMGAPWPINGTIIGDENTFEIKPFGESSHVGIFKAKESFRQSNAIINLQNFDMPIIVKLVSSDEIVDARVSVRIPRFGPDTRGKGVTRSSGVVADDSMLAVLNGDQVQNSVEYTLEGVEGSAWYHNGNLILRTKAELVVPPYKEVLRSPTGYNVFKLPAVTNLSFTDNGELVGAKILKKYKITLNKEKTIFD